MNYQNLFLITLCLTVNSILSAYIPTVDDIVKVIELDSQLTGVGSKIYSNEKLKSFDRNIKDSKVPVLAVINVRNANNQIVPIPVMILKQDENQNVFQMFQNAWSSMTNQFTSALGNIIPSSAGSASSSPTTTSTTPLPVSPESNDESGSSGSSQPGFPNPLEWIQQGFGNIMQGFTQMTQQMSGIQQTFQSFQDTFQSMQQQLSSNLATQWQQTVGSTVNSVNNLQSNNNNAFLADMLNSLNLTITTTTEKVASNKSTTNLPTVSELEIIASTEHGQKIKHKPTEEVKLDDDDGLVIVEDKNELDTTESSMEVELDVTTFDDFIEVL